MKRIEPTLRVEFLDPPERFAILHPDQLGDRFDEAVEKTALEFQQTAAAYGHIIAKADCLWMAAQAMRDRTVVFYVANEDGSFRQPDARDLKKLERMNHLRTELGVEDWKRWMSAKADVLRDQRLRSGDDVWQSIKSDRVFQRMASDALWNLKPTRSVIVPDNFGGARAAGATGA